MKKRQTFYYILLIILNFGQLFSQNLDDVLKTESANLELKKEFLENIQGIWILKTSGCNWGMEDTSKSETDEILIIDNKEITCYSRQKKSKKMELKWSDDIVINNKIYSQNSNDLIVSNYWIWNFTYSKENDFLYFTHVGEMMADGMVNVTVCGNLEKTYQRFK
jgi:hypothetical protein